MSHLAFKVPLALYANPPSRLQVQPPPPAPPPSSLGRAFLGSPLDLDLRKRHEGPQRQPTMRTRTFRGSVASRRTKSGWCSMSSRYTNPGGNGAVEWARAATR